MKQPKLHLHLLRRTRTLDITSSGPVYDAWISIGRGKAIIPVKSFVIESPPGTLNGTLTVTIDTEFVSTKLQG